MAASEKPDTKSVPPHHPGRVPLGAPHYADPGAEEILSVWFVQEKLSVALRTNYLAPEGWGVALEDILHQAATSLVEDSEIKDEGGPMSVDEVKEVIMRVLQERLGSDTAQRSKKWEADA